MESIAYALPVLLLLIAFEYYTAKRKNLKYYEFKDTITNFSISILDRVTAILFAGFFYFVYNYLYIHFAIFHFEQTWYNWVILFILVDFLWYWYHRAGHEVNLFWAVHVVHHSSNEYNLTVGTRITILQSLVRLAFWGILPIIGFSANMIMLSLLIQGVYPFFVHTRFIGKLHPVIEFFLVTPSHHRVHHGSNEIYIDKNYGSISIVWDRVFGTFQEEVEEVRYGLSKPIESRSLLWHIFHYFAELYYAIQAEKSFVNKVKILFGKPELVDGSLRVKLEEKFLTPKFQNNTSLSVAFERYIIAQIVFSIVSLLILLYFYNDIILYSMWLSACIIIFTLINCGAILERKRWVFYLEYVRFINVLILINMYFNVLFVHVIGFVLLFLSIMFFDTLRKTYMRHLTKNMTSWE